jgi:hypothetical protein
MGHQYQCEQPRCDKSYVRLRDFKEHMRVIHGRVISAEDARSREQIRGHENVPRATSVGSQRAVPATNANSHLWTAMQAPVAASQLVTNIQQANPSLISQQPIYTQTVQTLPPLYSTPNHLQPSYDQLVQRLSTTASENRLLHQHVVALQQQFQSLRLERDKYATAYVQLRQQMAQQQQQQIGSQGMSHQLGQFGP